MREALLVPANRKALLLCLFGVTAGQGAVVYVGHAYVLFFLTNTLQLDLATASKFAMANALTTFFFVPFLCLALGQDRPLEDYSGRPLVCRHSLAARLRAAFAGRKPGPRGLPGGQIR